MLVGISILNDIFMYPDNYHIYYELKPINLFYKFRWITSYLI